MSVPESPSKSKISEQFQKLRQELKEWERCFAAASGGRKAGHEDIKQHPGIAKKYKAYDKLRSALSQPQPQRSSSSRPSKKRHLPASDPPPSIQTPKRTKRSQPLHPSILDPYHPPITSSLTPIHYHASLAPTAQKDGRVLGLFDLLSDTSGNCKTPSKRSSLRVTALNALTTPSKCPLNDSPSKSLTTPKHHAKSPQSVSKRNVLSTLLTPSTRCVVESRTPGSRSHSGVSKLRFDETPAFLRRDSQRAHTNPDAEGGDNDNLPWSPVRMRTKPVGRGLSALVKGLRALEEEKLDEDLDLLRELEVEQDGYQNASVSRNPPLPKVLVEDSQAPEMPLGPDRGLETDTEDEDALEEEGKGQDGKPLKVWKKKGQKRSTRRVTMRPVTAKWKPKTEWRGGEKDDVEDKVDVGDTQVVDAGGDNKGGKPGQGYVDDDDENNDELAYEEDKRTGVGKEARKWKEKEKAGEEAPKKKKMVAATAHANFRALKIRGKGSKGKGGGKFGRRR